MNLQHLGLIVNPLAGIGGRVGLKGSDGAETVQRALQMGAVPEAPQRAALALQNALHSRESLLSTVELVTYPGEMGEESANLAGWSPTVIGQIQPGATTAEDTRRAAREMEAMGVDLLLFAGGDGTARDIYQAVDTRLPVLGIPAGVKVHSAVYAVRPEAAGELITLYLAGKARLKEAEILDLDEQAYRQDQISPRLYGYLRVPYRPRLLQNQKVPSPASEAHQAEAIAVDIVDELEPGWLYILGPGTTTRAIADRLGVEKTLVGVDVIQDGIRVATDVNQDQLLALLDQAPARIVVSPIGGQGFLFGRGNQQIGPAVLHRVARQDILVVCTQDKLDALSGRPFLLDTGDLEIDRLLSGYYRVITGYHKSAVYLASAH